MRKWAGHLVALLIVAAEVAALRLLGSHINPTTVALLLLLAVLFVATRWGASPAILASVVSVLSLNYFFLPPVGTLTIRDPDNWVALIVFLLTAVIAGQLSARAKQREQAAKAGRQEIERLYEQLREAFERASEAEAYKQSERLKSALLDAVTHDLRTPLTSIKASATTLLDELRTGKPWAGALSAESWREMLQVIDEETDRLNHFIEGLVTLARIEAGEMKLRRRAGALDEIIRAAFERAAPLARQHKAEVLIEDDLPPVSVDPRAVSEVIYTLVDNAVKYSPAGTYVHIVAHREDEHCVRLMVEDHGPGIPVELRQRVFDKFFRATRDGDAHSIRPSGTGMGLAIARGIVEAHGGRIWIESGVGGAGTRVSLTLPIADAGQTDAALAQEAEDKESGPTVTEVLRADG